MTSPALLRALDDSALGPFPAHARALLERLDAPPRLAAHLRLVHGVARELCTWLAANHPAVPVDRAAAEFGAATHDIGKILHPAELSGPGSAHEEAGRALLVEHGVAPDLARFARTHSAWHEPGIGIEDLVVSLADKVWKGKRVADLEQLVVDRLAAARRCEAWKVFLPFDDELAAIAAGADRALAFQARFPLC